MSVIFSDSEGDQASSDDFSSNRIRFFSKVEKSVPALNNKPQGQVLIPKIIHQVWIGSPLPERFKKLTQTWKEMHPDWEYFLWTDEDTVDFPFLNRDKFDGAKNWGAKADILRYEILEMMGGVYIDIDYECIKPLDQFHYEYEFYSCVLVPGYITNALIGCIPHHPILQRTLENLKNSKTNTVTFEDVLEEFGPHYFSKWVYEYFSTVTDPRVCVFKKEFSFPMSCERRFDYWNGYVGEQELAGYRNSSAFAIHYWATSWQVSN